MLLRHGAYFLYVELPSIQTWMESLMTTHLCEGHQAEKQIHEEAKPTKPAKPPSSSGMPSLVLKFPPKPPQSNLTLGASIILPAPSQGASKVSIGSAVQNGPAPPNVAPVPMRLNLMQAPKRSYNSIGTASADNHPQAVMGTLPLATLEPGASNRSPPSSPGGSPAAESPSSLTSPDPAKPKFGLVEYDSPSPSPLVPIKTSSIPPLSLPTLSQHNQGQNTLKSSSELARTAAPTAAAIVEPLFRDKPVVSALGILVPNAASVEARARGLDIHTSDPAVLIQALMGILVTLHSARTSLFPQLQVLGNNDATDNSIERICGPSLKGAADGSGLHGHVQVYRLKYNGGQYYFPIDAVLLKEGGWNEDVFTQVRWLLMSNACL
jgi:hypothetical protein